MVTLAEKGTPTNSPKVAKKGEASGKDKPLAILMVQPWKSLAKQRITQSFSSKFAISFPPLGEEDGTEGPMIIEAEMGGHFVHRMYMDGGSASKILYKHCFSRLWQRRHGTLNFRMDELHARKVAISIQWNHWQTRSKKDSIRPINSLWNVKVPGRRRSGNTTYSRIILLECAMVSGPGAQQPVIDQLRSLLRRNLDIFAWKPTNMTRVSRHIVEHKLNVREGCLPIRQKKRGQALERNKAIQDEVEKLVDVGIMKEGHYHMWLSNPVMVKKHDLENVYRFQRFEQSMPQRRISAARNRLEVWIKECQSNFPVFGGQCFTKANWLELESVYADGLKVCPYIVDAVLILPSPKSLKDVQRLGSQLYTNEEIGIGPSKCQQVAKEILPGTYNYRDNESADKADTVKSRERPEEESSDVPWKKKENSQNHGFCLLMDLHVLTVSELDSKLVANQVNGSYIAKELGMIQYLEKVRMLTQSFKGFLIKQGPRGENKKADALSKIASTSFAHLSKEVLVEELKEKQINEKEMLAIVEEEGCTWMTLVYEYLTKEILPEDKKEARVICRKAGRYAIINKILYEKSFLGPWLRCVGPLQANYVLREIHEGSCSMHTGPRSVVAKAIRIGNPQQNLTPITSPWPFYKWGIDIARPFLEGSGKVKFLIVAIDYFTKWIKEKPMATITRH
ncbi:reverse transcriptase domain-containing protein [Tanacetum coccineum]